MSESTAPASEEAPKDYFNSLPNELLEQIAGHLQLSDKLKFRLLMRKDDHEFITSILKKHFERVYVGPTKRSLRNFAGICRSKFYNEHIKEVIFTPQTYEPPSSALSSLHTFRELLRKSLEEGPYLEEDEMVALLEDWFCFEGGPHKLVPRESFVSRSFTIHQQVAKEYCRPISDFENRRMFKDLVGQLKFGLSQLPKLNTAVIATEVECMQDGLNVTTLWTSERLNESDLHIWSSDFAISYALKPLVPQICGTRAFYTALSSLGSTVPSLHISRMDDLRRANDLDSPALLNGLASSNYSTKLTTLHLSRLQTLSTTLDAKDLSKLWHSFSKNAVCLTTLSIVMGEEKMIRVSGCDSRVVDIILRSGTSPKLQQLKIVGSPYTVVLSPRLHGKLRATDLLEYLDRHKQTLRQVELHGLYAHMGDQHTVGLWMRRTLAWMQKELHLDKCVMTVHNHSRRNLQCSCKSDPRSCNRRFTHYWVNRKMIFHRAVFDQLAEDLGVAEEDRWWDFGQVVLRESVPQQLVDELDEYLGEVKAQQASNRRMFGTLKTAVKRLLGFAK